MKRKSVFIVLGFNLFLWAPSVYSQFGIGIGRGGIGVGVGPISAGVGAYGAGVEVGSVGAGVGYDNSDYYGNYEDNRPYREYDKFQDENVEDENILIDEENRFGYDRGNREVHGERGHPAASRGGRYSR